MSDDTFELSRRKALGGLATIGLAGAGAGLGTSALYSDTETLGGNSVTAGTLDLSVTGTVVAASPYFSSGDADILSQSSTADGSEAAMGLDLDDFKPGDWVIVCFDVVVEDNPGYVRILADELKDEENGHEDPETGPAGNGDGSGELAEAMLTTIWEDFSGETDVAPFDGTKDDLSRLDPTTNVDSNSVRLGGGYQSSNEDGVVNGNGNVQYTTLREAFETYDSESTEGVVIGGSDSPTEVGDDEEPDEDGVPQSQTFYLLFEVPASVGNEIMSDSVSLDLVFQTEQVRNNDTAFDGDSAVSTASGSGGSDGT